MDLGSLCFTIRALWSCLVVVVAGFIAIGEGVDFWVLSGKKSLWEILRASSLGLTYMEEAVVAISPWESLGSDSQILVLHELRAMNCHFLMFQVCIQHAQADGGNCHEQRQALPQLPAFTWWRYEKLIRFDRRVTDWWGKFWFEQFRDTEAVFTNECFEGSRSLITFFSACLIHPLNSFICERSDR